jgi:hypothetical protein
MFDSEPHIENLKEIKMIEQVKELLREHCQHGWVWADFLNISKSKPDNKFFLCKGHFLY